MAKLIKSINPSITSLLKSDLGRVKEGCKVLCHAASSIKLNIIHFKRLLFLI